MGIFPFYINGELYDTCRLLNRDDFIVPVNICPVRNITTKINGINSYTVDKIDDLLESYLYCTNNETQQADDLLPPLDPDKSCKFFKKRSAFSRCKNNCIRVSFPVVAGGSALIFVASATALSPLVTASLGILGI